MEEINILIYNGVCNFMIKNCFYIPFIYFSSQKEMLKILSNKYKLNFITDSSIKNIIKSKYDFKNIYFSNIKDYRKEVFYNNSIYERFIDIIVIIFTGIFTLLFGVIFINNKSSIYFYIITLAIFLFSYLITKITVYEFLKRKIKNTIIKIIN